MQETKRAVEHNAAVHSSRPLQKKRVADAQNFAASLEATRVFVARR